MSEDVSIDGLIEELRQLMTNKYKEGVSVRLECDPKVTVRGKEITVLARIFAPATALAGFSPVLRCKEAAGFGDRPLAKREGSGFNDYTLKFHIGARTQDDTYHFTLHLSRGQGPIAECAVRVLKKEIFDGARRYVRHAILGPSGGKSASSRRRRR